MTTSGPTPTLLDRLAGVQAEDEEDLRFNKRLQTTMTLASLPIMSAVGTLFLGLGRPSAAAFPFVYVVLSVVLQADLALTRSYDRYREAHTGLVLLLPFLLHMYLGGFAASGGWLLWCLIPPSAAMMFVGARRSLRWFVALLLLLVLGGLRELGLGPAPADPLPPRLIQSFFVINTLGLAGFVFLSTRHFVQRLEQEKARSERLLLNILPAEIAARLKQGEELIADRAEAVTVVFSDLVGFTKLSQERSAPALVALLDAVFREFDDLADQHGLEKIKTIGDAYLAVAGLPTPQADHADRAAAFALGMVEAVERAAAREGAALAMRVGLHSGPVVAGVIGKRKFAYDLWGDTVNTASRMESHGEPGRVQLSAATAALLSGRWRIEERGEIEVKGKGPLHTSWLLGPAA